MRPWAKAADRTLNALTYEPWRCGSSSWSTRDYLEVYKAIGEITFMRSTGNALIGSIQEVYDRYLRTVERRFPMIVIVSNDGADFSQRVTAGQYKQVSPDRVPAEEFKRAGP